MKYHITIEEILERNHFSSAHVIAGRKGLNKLVKWIHVFEMIEVRGNLKGGELVLSTGFGWKDNEDLFLVLLKQLIAKNVAGICIELKSFIEGISQEAIEFADRHDFPIITFEEEVSFVEITQDIHADLINKQYEFITNLENYTQRLNKRLLSIDNYFEILKNLQQYVNVQLVYKTHDHKVITIPTLREKEQEEMLFFLENPTSLASKRVIRQPVRVFEKEYSYIYLISHTCDFGEFESLLSDRTATALAQYLMRELYTKVKKKAKETEWLMGWLQGEHSLEEIEDQLAAYKLRPSGAVVLTIKLKLENNDPLDLDSTYLNMLIHNIFDQNGYFVFPVQRRRLLTLILVNKKQENDWKSRVLKGIERVEKLSLFNNSRISSFQLAGGKYIRDLHQLHESYQTAQETLTIQKKLAPGPQKYFYEDMHMYRLISIVNQHSNLNSLVEEYLEPVIQYDEKHKTHLLETLKVYLACHGSKKETSKRVFVVRQTLYHRLEKLEKLLGEDFMDSEKRQAIEFALLAYQYQQRVPQ